MESQVISDDYKVSHSGSTSKLEGKSNSKNESISGMFVDSIKEEEIS